MRLNSRYILGAVLAGWVLVSAGAAVGDDAAYQPGEHVEVYSSMTGRWEKATIVRLDGTMTDGRPRYFIHADDPNISSAYWGTTADQIRRAGPAPGASPAGDQQADVGAAPGDMDPESGPNAFAAAPVAEAAANALPTCRVGMHAPIVSPLNYGGTLLAYDAARGAYQVRSDGDGLVDWVPSRQLRFSCVGGEAAPITTAFFVGRWSLFVGPTPNHVTHGDEVDLEVGRGGRSPPITVNADGTYVWRVDSATTVRGRWHALAPGEARDRTVGPAILLVAGEGGHDWQMSRSGIDASTGHDKVAIDRMDLGESYMGTRS